MIILCLFVFSNLKIYQDFILFDIFQKNKKKINIFLKALLVFG